MRLSWSPLQLIRPARKITGMSAILLPFHASGEVDWNSFRSHVQRTLDARLIPAVNMDTGFVHLLDESTKRAVLTCTKEIAGGRQFVAGAFVRDEPGFRFNHDAYCRQCEQIAHHGGIPVIFPSYGLVELDDSAIIAAFDAIASSCDRFIGFELGKMFAPFGRIFSLDVVRGLMSIKGCLGIKHSSLSRLEEWERLRLRDEIRPDFHIFTGNDLAIDMVMYGSDYLLGLSTFAPDKFAERDRLWEEGDPAFHELNDTLQYLGFFAFRSPVPAYKHSAAMFLRLRGWIECDATHPASPTRPDSEVPVLRDIGRLLDIPMRD